MFPIHDWNPSTYELKMLNWKWFWHIGITFCKLFMRHHADVVDFSRIGITRSRHDLFLRYVRFGKYTGFGYVGSGRFSLPLHIHTIGIVNSKSFNMINPRRRSDNPISCNTVRSPHTHSVFVSGRQNKRHRDVGRSLMAQRLPLKVCRCKSAFWNLNDKQLNYSVIPF